MQKKQNGKQTTMEKREIDNNEKKGKETNAK